MTAAHTAPSTCTVAQLRPGQLGRLISIGGERAYRRRLLELGLTPGAEVRVIKVAPMGDPIEIEVRGARLSMRRAEASRLVVSLLAESPAPSLRAILSLTLGTRSAA